MCIEKQMKQQIVDFVLIVSQLNGLMASRRINAQWKSIKLAQVYLTQLFRTDFLRKFPISYRRDRREHKEVLSRQEQRNNRR